MRRLPSEVVSLARPKSAPAPDWAQSEWSLFETFHYLLGLAVALIAIYILGGSLKNFIFSASSAKAPKCLEILGSTTVENGGVTAITGSIKNNCEIKYKSIQVSFTVDPTANSKSPATTAVAYGDELLPGKIWDFRTVPIAKNSTYQFKEILAY